MPSHEQLLYYLNGALYARLQFADGIYDGLQQYFYQDGKSKTIEHYQLGVLEGEVILYWPNGALKRRCFFAQGKREGPEQMWNLAGILLDEGHFSEGKPIGAHRRWAANGQLIEEMTYLDSFRFNLLQWDEQGMLRTEALWLSEQHYKERSWDRFQQKWVKKEGHFDGVAIQYV